MTRLNLANDDWITVAYTDGRVGRVGFRGLLAQAHDIRSIETGWSVSDNAVFDFALAIAYRSLDTSDEPGATATSKALRYLSGDALGLETGVYLDKWQEHFDIEVFGQVSGVPAELSVGADRLALELSSGGDDIRKIRPGSFRSISDVLNQSPIETALDLITTYRADLTKPSSALPGSQYDMLNAETKKSRSKPSDGKTYPNSKGSYGGRDMGGIGLGHYPRVVFGGRSFSETLILNMPTQSISEKAQDQAVWETNYTEIDSRFSLGYRGYADWLTYQSRAIQTFWVEEDTLDSVVVGPNNFRVTSGASGSHAPGDFSDKTGAFYASSPFLVSRAKKAPKDVSFDEWEALEKFLPMSLEAEVAWVGLTAFTANAGDAITTDSALRGKNVHWVSSLVSADVIARDAPLIVSYFGTAFGPSNTTYWVGYEDTYSTQGWLATETSAAVRRIIDQQVRRAQTVRNSLSSLENGVVKAATGDPKRKLNAKEVGLGAAQAYTGAISSALHRIISEARENHSLRVLPGLLSEAIREAALSAIERVETFYPAEIVAVSDIPKIIAVAKERIMSIVNDGSAPTEKALQKKVAETVSEEVEPEPWRKEISSFVNAKVHAAKRSASLRVDFADIGRSGDPQSLPGALMSAFKDWSEEITDRGAADIASQTALGIWGAASGATTDVSGGIPIFVVAKSLSGKTDAVERSVRAILSTKDRKQVSRHLSSLVSLLSSIKKTASGVSINIGDLAADLYELNINPKAVRYRWARQFSIGKAA